MCRVLAYLGKKIELSSLILDPENSLIRQSYQPRQMSLIQNLAGFGMVVWEKQGPRKSIPYQFRSTELPFHNANLVYLAENLASECVVAHVRGVTYSISETINEQNLHPFMFANAGICFAHNGNLADIEIIKKDLLSHVHPGLVAQIKGTTDSEMMYALFLTRLQKRTQDKVTTPDVENAIFDTYAIIKKEREKAGLSLSSALNFFVSNGEFLVICRFCLNFGHFPPGPPDSHYGYHSLWYTYGEKFRKTGNDYLMTGSSRSSIIFASEPLSDDPTSWMSIPEYTIISAWKEGAKIRLSSRDIDI